ncbi:MAG: TonB-dependent receptor, partial [Ignavibacteria bacterium]
MITIKHTPVFTILTLLIYLAYLTGLSYSQESGKITGKVYKLSQNNTEEAIEEASVTLSSYVSEKPQKLTAYTNDDGNYVIESIPPGMYNLKAEHKGFKFNEKKNVEITASETLNINFLLSEDSYTIEEIDIVAERFRQAQDDMRTSLLNLSPRTTKVIPGAGEDVLRSLQTLPGVTAPHDFSSQLIIRGSGPDQNLIVMDDVEIFNPYRLYGLFSMFNPETLEDINLITGGFPSKYGDRLSAVLDVMNKEGSRNSKFSGLANINIGNANLVFSGRIPIKELDGSWIVSTRRTYYDLILGPFAKNAGLIDESASFPSFQDIQAKVTLGPFKNHKFIGNAIFSKDGVDIIPGDSKEFEDSLTIRDATKNDVVSLAWHYAPSHKFLSRTTLSWYRNSGDADFGGELLDPVFDREIYNPEIRDSLKALGLFLGVGFSSKYFFRKYSVVNNIILMSNKHKFEIGGGVDIMKTDLQFKITIDDRLKSFIQNNPNFNVLQESFFEGKNYWRTNLYAQDRIKISNNLFVQTGVRFDYYDIIKKAYLSPRINLSYALNDLTTLRMGTGLYYQSPGYEKLIDGQVFYD